MDSKERLELYIKALEGKYGFLYPVYCNETELRHLSNYIDLANGDKPMTKDEKTFQMDIDVKHANATWTNPWWAWTQKWAYLKAQYEMVLASMKIPPKVKQ